jgi:hypothetical protein
LTEYGANGFHTFFGYHDIIPFDATDELLLANRCRASVELKTAGTPLELGYYNTSLTNPKFESFATTTSWCWQQGCRLQWYPNASKSNSMVFFNTSANGRHTSCIFDIRSRQKVKSFDRAIYALSHDGSFGVSLNFSRLQRLRPGYGYGDIIDTTIKDLSPDTDGLWIVDLNTGEDELILPLSEIAIYHAESSMNGATHYFNHILWSPNGKNFFFLHLWVTPEGKRHSRACIWNIKNKSFSLLGTDSIVSHHCWIDSKTLILFTKELDLGMRYHTYDIEKGCTGSVGVNLLCEDGHPSMSSINSALMVTDTYPNKIGEQSLIIFNVKNEALTTVARLYSPVFFRGEKRCDLHPRWNTSSNKVCVDSAHAGERKVCVFDVKNIVANVIK